MPESKEPPHDILAAEAFAVPARDPELEAAHDVLAAEAFAVPGADPSLHPDPVQLPGDPKGIEEPHDTLAAEDFPMPAPPRGHALSRPGPGRPGLPLRVAAGALVLLVLMRALRRRRSRSAS